MTGEDFADVLALNLKNQQWPMEDVMSCTNVRFIVCFTLICLTAAVVPASAQHFKQITGTPLSQIAVGGGTLLQSDEGWGLDSGGCAYRFNFSTKTFTLESGPGVLQLSKIAAGAGYKDDCHPYEVWGISSSYIYRYDYCTSQLENIGIAFVDTLVPAGGMFTQIAVSGAGDVWGLYPGSSAPAVLEFAGGACGGPGDTYGISSQQIAVGVNDVWAVDSTGLIWS